MNSKDNNLLRRYTDITSLLHILVHSNITLLDPKTWDDKNDSKYLRIYKDNTKLQAVFALCFTESPETYHHWKVFAPGNSGVCIWFKKDELLKAIDKSKKTSHGKVEYKTLDELHDNPPTVEELPYLKRYPFRGEEEYRIIYKSQSNSRPSASIKIGLNSISQIVMSPWLDKSLAQTLRATLKSLDECENIRIYQTTLNDNRDWYSYGYSAV